MVPLSVQPVLVTTVHVPAPAEFLMRKTQLEPTASAICTPTAATVGKVIFAPPAVPTVQSKITRLVVWLLPLPAICAAVAVKAAELFAALYAAWPPCV